MRTTIRTLVLLYAAAAGVATTAVVLALGLPLAARGSLGPGEVALVALAAGTIVLFVAAGLLVRGVGRPVDHLFAIAARFGGQEDRAGELPILGDPVERGGPALARAAVAFERLALALEDERTRLAAKVAELTDANRALADARESLVRSEKLATVGRLAAGLAHEVGNPLGAVRGYVDLARTKLPAQPSPDLVDALSRIDAAAQRIDRTVRDLLDFARPAPVALAPVDVGRAVDASLRLARVQSRFREVLVERDLAGGLPCVLADEHHLHQVLLNLLLNAGDATKGAGRVRVVGRPDGDGAVVLRIEDDGPGIAAEDLPRVFDPFFTTKAPGEGTGLGLAISHRIMESFGGEIAARSEQGRGAVFELRFRAC